MKAAWPLGTVEDKNPFPQELTLFMGRQKQYYVKDRKKKEILFLNWSLLNTMMTGFH